MKIPKKQIITCAFVTSGLHTESHGITGNFMYDKDVGDTFKLGTNPDHVHPHWWDKAEPLWISAKKQVCIDIFLSVHVSKCLCASVLV